MIAKSNKGWRNVLMLCASAAVAVLVSSCNSPAPEVGRYQWNIIGRDENGQERIYVSDTVTGEVAEWDGYSWRPSYRAPLSTPDWSAIRKDREWQKKIQAEEKKKREEARVKREALVKAYALMPLEKQVAWARDIRICKYRGKRSSTIDVEIFTTLKGKRGPDENRWPYKSTDEGLVVWVSGMVEGANLSFVLSRTPIDSKEVFLAPATIIDDVKAEIKRQEEQKK